MRIHILYYTLIVVILLASGCKKRYSDEYWDLSVFERFAHERTDDEVMEEWRKGYIFKDKLLRPAQVKVNKIQN